MADSVQFVDDASATEWRFYQRYSISSFSCVQLDGDNGGIVLDISERGLSMQIVRSLADDQFARIRFQLLRSESWIETRARIIWANRSRTIVGVQFEGLSYEGKILISHWISSVANLKVSETRGDFSKNVASAKSSVASEAAAVISGLKPETNEHPGKSPNRYSNSFTDSLFAPTAHSKVTVAACEAATGPLLITKTRAPESPRKSEVSSGAIRATTIGSCHGGRWAFLILFGSLLAGLGLFGLSRHQRGRHVAGENLENRVAIGQPSRSADTLRPQADLEPREELHPVSVVSEIVPGFFLQAGAMKVEENAEELVRSLQRKEFAGFILKQARSPFYTVLVGPYTNLESASRMRVQLQEQGFQTIIMRAPSR